MHWSASLRARVHAALCAVLLSSSACSAAELFVAPGGDDGAGDGSFARPFATPARALAAVDALPRPWSANASISLRGGTYALSAPLVLAPGGGGRDGFALALRAYAPDAAPAILSGGLPVAQSAWERAAPGSEVWAAPCPAGTPAGARQVWADGARVTETFLGNATSVYGYQLLSNDDTVVTETGYLTNSTRFLRAAAHPLQLASDAEFLFRMVGSQWVEERVRVTSWEMLEDGKTLNITLAQPAFYMLRHKLYVGSFPSHVINLAAALEGDPLIGTGDGIAVSGSGYVSGANEGSAGACRLLFRAAPGGGAPVEAVVGALDSLLVLEGNRSAQPAALTVIDVSIEGLVFKHSAWLAPSGPCGYIPDQSGIFYECSDAAQMPGMGHALTGRVPGALALKTARRVRVFNCSFAHTGANGIVVEEGSQFIEIGRSLFSDVGGSAVRFGQVDDWSSTDESRFNSDCSMSDSVLLGLAVELRDCAAVMGGYFRRLTLQSNTIRNASWAGITIGWGWGQHESPLPTHGGNLIAQNDVQFVNLLTSDGGPIYVMGPQQWSEMTGNFVGHALHHAAMLYHDEGSGYWHTHHNVVNESTADQFPCGGWW